MDEYVGLADCHGIEAFKRLSDCPTHWSALLQMRARANDHRHAVAFKVKLTESEAKQIIDLVEHAQYIDALNVLKTMSGVMLQEGFQGRWRNIPNPMLDPYWEGRPIKNERTTSRELD